MLDPGASKTTGATCEVLQHRRPRSESGADHHDFADSRAGKQRPGLPAATGASALVRDDLDYQGQLSRPRRDGSGCMDCHAREVLQASGRGQGARLPVRAQEPDRSPLRHPEQEARGTGRRGSAGRWAPGAKSRLPDDFRDLPAGLPRKIPNGSSSAKAIDYTLKRCGAPVHHLTDGNVPIDNNWIENQIRPVPSAARAGSCRLAARRQAGGGHEPGSSPARTGRKPFAYLKDGHSRACRLSRRAGSARLLPHRWKPDGRRLMPRRPRSRCGSPGKTP